MSFLLMRVSVNGTPPLKGGECTAPQALEVASRERGGGADESSYILGQDIAIDGGIISLWH